jgi:hypothetical protein
MIIRIYFILLISIIFLISSKSHAQQENDIQGKYSVGKTSCTIEWDSGERAYKVYWKEGIGYTLLFYDDVLPNGNIVYKEYESDGNTYTGKFTFKDISYRRGEYERSDGTTLTVKRR